MVIYRLGLPYYKEFDNFQFIEQTPLLFVSQKARPARAAPFGLLHCYSREGVHKWSVRTGDIPAHMVFLERKQTQQ